MRTLKNRDWGTRTEPLNSFSETTSHRDVVGYSSVRTVFQRRARCQGLSTLSEHGAETSYRRYRWESFILQPRRSSYNER